MPCLKARTHLPLVVDPGHAVGRREIVPYMAKAAIVVGATGVMVEVHPNPSCALCDGPQSLPPDDFEALMKNIGI